MTWSRSMSFATDSGDPVVSEVLQPRMFWYPFETSEISSSIVSKRFLLLELEACGRSITSK